MHFLFFVVISNDKSEKKTEREKIATANFSSSKESSNTSGIILSVDGREYDCHKSRKISISLRPELYKLSILPESIRAAEDPPPEGI